MTALQSHFKGVDVEEVLGSVLAADPFRRSKRLADFLTYVVHETEAGRGHLLKEHAIAVGALGCNEAFDPRFDPRVRVTAGRVRKALDRYYEVAGAGDVMRIEMPRGSYQAFIAERRWDEPPHQALRTISAHEPAVAVVSFVDLDHGADQSHLAVGLPEALVATMASYPGCRVLGPIGLEDGRDAVERARSLRSTMDVTHVLEGSVRTSQAVIRVSVRLTDTQNGEVVWSEVFDEDVDGLALFEVEDRIVRRVSGVVADFRGVIHRKPSHQPPASGAEGYDAKLQYYAYLGDLDASKVRPTTVALERALERSPDDPLLMAMLAGMVLFSGVGQLGAPDAGAISDDMVKRAVELARRSNALDPANPHALTVLAIVELLHGHPDRCRVQLDRVIEMRPTNPSLLFMAGVALAMSGDWALGIERIRESMDLNPLHPGWQHGFLALDELIHDDASLALEEAQLVDTPGLVWGPLLRAATLAQLGREDEAAVEMAQMPAALPAEQPQLQNLFEGHMRLPDDVVAVLVNALGRIPVGPVEGAPATV